MANATIHILGDHPIDGSGTEILAWLAIVCAWLAFGSFAMPMKWPTVVHAQVHPLIYQAYKTFWTFLISHAVLLFQPFEFSVFGIASGFSWVPGGIAAIVAVQNVGVACGQAIWQVTIIVSSLMWGFLILHDEKVTNIGAVVLSAFALCTGVVGMIFTFHSQSSTHIFPKLSEHHPCTPATGVFAGNIGSGTPSQSQECLPASTLPFRNDVNWGASKIGGAFTHFGTFFSMATSPKNKVPEKSWALGIGAAVFNGMWGGWYLIPQHYAPYHGVHFILSFAWGALLANIVLLAIYAILSKYRWGTPFPDLHVRVMALPGFVSGALWTVGNFCSLYAVNALGQGIGFSIIQSSIIVSGMWGIVYYGELSGIHILYWSCWMCVCLAGVAGLAAENKM